MHGTVALAPREALTALVSLQLNARMVEKAQQLKLHCEDLLGPLVTTVSEYLEQVPSGRPRFSTQVDGRSMHVPGALVLSLHGGADLCA